MPEHDQAKTSRADPQLNAGLIEKATLEDRIAVLEATVSAMAEHQTNLGASLIRAHGVLIRLERDMAAEGIAVADDAAANSIIGVRPPRIIT